MHAFICRINKNPVRSKSKTHKQKTQITISYHPFPHLTQLRPLIYRFNLQAVKCEAQHSPLRYYSVTQLIDYPHGLSSLFWNELVLFILFFIFHTPFAPIIECKLFGHIDSLQCLDALDDWVSFQSISQYECLINLLTHVATLTNEFCYFDIHDVFIGWERCYGRSRCDVWRITFSDACLSHRSLSLIQWHFLLV